MGMILRRIMQILFGELGEGFLGGGDRTEQTRGAAGARPVPYKKRSYLRFLMRKSAATHAAQIGPSTFHSGT